MIAIGIISSLPTQGDYMVRSRRITKNTELDAGHVVSVSYGIVALHSMRYRRRKERKE